MTVRRYMSTDVSAPVLDGQAGSLINVLDACLVNGYGAGAFAKAPAGWAKAFAGTNKAAYRALSGNRFYYRVVDDGSSSATYTTRKAGLFGFESMSDVDTGTGPFASAVRYVTKSDQADAVARAWVVIADERAFYLFINHLSSAPRANGYFAGEMVRFDPADNFCSGLIGDGTDVSPASDPNSITGFAHHIAVTAQFSSSTGIGQLDMPRALTQVSGSFQRGTLGAWPVFGHRGPSTSAFHQDRNYQMQRSLGIAISGAGDAYPAPGPGLPLFPVMCLYGTSTTANVASPGYRMRGLMPGLYDPQINVPFASLTEVDGVSSLPGRTLLAISVGGQYYAPSTSGPFSGAALTLATAQVLVDFTGPWR